MYAVVTKNMYINSKSQHKYKSPVEKATIIFPFSTLVIFEHLLSAHTWDCINSPSLHYVCITNLVLTLHSPGASLTPSHSSSRQVGMTSNEYDYLHFTAGSTNRERSKFICQRSPNLHFPGFSPVLINISIMLQPQKANIAVGSYKTIAFWIKSFAEKY